MVAIGEIAPDFTTNDSDGHPFHLADLRGKQRVVLYFFPKCFTTGCDIEGKGFRDQFPRYQGNGTQIIGVSADPPDVAQAFRKKFELPFPVLPDPDKKVIQLYGVQGMFGLARRVTFQIGLDGRVENVVDSMRPGPHIDKTLKELEKSSPPSTPPG
jgi:peroxiredoxin Q/BCP